MKIKLPKKKNEVAGGMIFNREEKRRMRRDKKYKIAEKMLKDAALKKISENIAKIQEQAESGEKIHIDEEMLANINGNSE
jgi:hypothetical protein